MAFVKKTWLDRAAQHLSRRILNIISSTGTTMVADVSRGDTDVTEVGTPLNAENLNDLENRIADALVTMTGATSSSNGKEGLVPAPKNTERLYFLRGDGTWQEAGGGSYVLPTASQTTKGGIKVQRSDAFYVVNDFLKVATFGGASATGSGSKGIVPQPLIGDQKDYLRGDGLWTALYYEFDSGTIAVTDWSDGSQNWLDSVPQYCGESSSKCYERRITFNGITEDCAFELTGWTESGWTANAYVYCLENTIVVQTARKPDGVVRFYGRIVN